MFKRIMSILLVLAMAVSYVPVAAAAESAQIQEAGTDVSFESTNSFGNLITNSMEEENVSFDSTLNHITRIEVDKQKRIADVQLVCTVDAKLVVALYTEDGTEMLGSGTAKVSADADSAQVKLDMEKLPDYFLIRAYLLDSESNDPVASEYVTSLYIKQIQDLMNATVEDFPEEQVLNLDGDNTTNFAVFSESTILVKENGPQNQISKQDGYYVIKNADERFRNMQVGEAFAWWESDDEIHIVKAAAVTVQGTTVTVQEDTDAQLADVFEAVKIDTSMDPDSVVHDTSSMDPDLEVDASYSGTDMIAQFSSDEDGDHQSELKEEKFNFKEKKDDSSPWKVNIDGYLVYGFSFDIDIAATKETTVFTYKVESALTADITVSAKLEKQTKELGKFQMLFGASGLKGILKVSVSLEAEAKLHVTANFYGSIGRSFDSTTNDWSDIGEPFKPTLGAEIDGKITIGLIIDASIAVISEKVANGGVTGGIYVIFDVHAWTRGIEEVKENADSVHTCKVCSEGKISLQLTLGFHYYIFIMEDGESRTFDLPPMEPIELCKVHLSGSKDPNQKVNLGFGPCPNRAYRVNMGIVSEQDFLPLEGASVRILQNGRPATEVYDIRHEKVGGLDDNEDVEFNDGYRVVEVSADLGKTDSKAFLHCYLPNGTYTIELKKDNKTVTKDLSIQDHRKNVTLTMERPDWLQLSQNKLELPIESSEQLKVTVETSHKDVTLTAKWTSSDEKVATVAKGVVTGVSVGTAKITAETLADDGRTITDECEVTVLPHLALSEENLELYTTDPDVKLVVKMRSTGKDVTRLCTWQSANSKVVTVKDGTLCPVGEGKTQVTVTYKDGDKTYQALCDVTVKQGLKLSKDEVQLSLGGQSEVLSVTLANKSEDVTGACDWTSSNPKVVSVKDGRLTPKGSGTAVVTASYKVNGRTCTVSCKVTVAGIKLSQTMLVMNESDKGVQLKATLTGSGKDVTGTCTWTSSNAKVVTVSKTALVTPVGAGEATVTASFRDGANTYKETCKVVVLSKDSGQMTFAKNPVKLTLGGEGFQQKVYFQGKDVTAESTWTSLDEDVVKADKGLLKAVGTGTTKVAVSYTGQTGAAAAAAFDVVVLDAKNSDLAVEPEGLQLKSGETGTLKVTQKSTGLDVTAECSYTSTDEKVATVQKGTVTPVGSGSAEILITYGGSSVICPVVVFDGEIVATGSCGESLTWILDGSGMLTILGSGKMEDYPSSSAPWKKYEDQITSLNITEGVESIGNYAFYTSSWSPKLTGDLVIPESVTSIGEYAFYGCSKLTGDLVIPDSVTSIGRDAFCGCSGLDGTLTLSKNLESIGEYAFNSCRKLTGDLVIPEGITEISEGTFLSCSGFNGELILPNSLKTIGAYAFKEDSGLIGDLVIPAGVTAIEDSAFYKCGFSGDLTLPEGLVTLGNYGFYNCGFTGDLVIPGSLKVIGASAFSGFGKDSGTLTICGGVEEIGNYAFSGSRLTGDLVIPDTVKKIGNNAFSNGTFNGTLRLSASLTSLGDSAFFGCKNLRGDLILPDSLTVIPYYAFYNCGFTGRLQLPKGLKQIVERAFEECSGLTGTLELPDTLTTIGYRAFYSCSGLTGDLTIPASVKNNLGASTFERCSGFNGILTLPESMTAIPQSAFSGCSGLRGLKMSSSVRSIGASAFSGCGNMRGDLILPDTLSSLGVEAFWGVGFDGTLHISTKLTEIPEYAFSGAGFTGDLVIPGNIRVIKEQAFWGCRNFTGTLQLSEGLVEIETFAFSGCRGLTGDLVIPEGVTSIGDRVFGYLDGMKKNTLYLPRSITKIGYDAFSDVLSFIFAQTIYAGTAEEWAKVSGNNQAGKNVLFNGGSTQSLDAPEAFLTDPEETTEPTEVEETTDPTEEPTEPVETIEPTEPEETTEAPEETEETEETDPTEEPTEDLEGYYIAPEGAEMEEGEVQTMSAHTGKETVKNGVRTASFTGLEPGEEYVLIVSLKPGSVEPEDLMYIAQDQADSKGSLSFRYIPRKDVSAIVQLYGLPAERYITLDREYLAMQAGAKAEELTASVVPESWAKYLTWTAEGNPEEKPVIAVSESGSVTPLNPGTAYAVASLTYHGEALTARCRVDVTENQTDMEVWSVNLGTQKVTTELYSTDYTEIPILPRLEQNEVMAFSAAPENNGAAVTEAYLADRTAQKYFQLRVKDDRTLLLVPTARALAEAKSIKSTLTSPIVVFVNGTPYRTQPVTIAVKKTKPKLKAGSVTFNPFYTEQSQALSVTGGTVTKIERDTQAKGAQWPSWLKLDGTKLTLTKDAPKSGSASLNLLVYTAEWAVPVSLKVSAKLSYKAPALKLSASSVSLSDSGSKGTSLKLTAGKQSLEALNVKDITLPMGFGAANLDIETGSFDLIPTGEIPTGKQTVRVSFYGTDATLDLPLTVSKKSPVLKLSKTSVNLNGELGDSVKLKVTAAPKDFDLTQVTIGNGNEALEVSPVDAEGEFTLRVRKSAAPKATYALTVQAPTSKAVKLTVKTLAAGQKVTMSLKAVGSIDLTYPEKGVDVQPTFKNYSGELKNVSYSLALKQGKNTMDASFGDYLTLGEDGLIRWNGTGSLTAGTICMVTMEGSLPDGSTISGTVQMKVTQTAVALKLGKTSLNLNKRLGESTQVTVASGTKTYTLGALSLRVVDSKNVPTDGLTASYENGLLTLAVNNATAYGSTYKVQLWATPNKISTVTVKIPAEKASAVAMTAKASGSIDVIRDSSEILVMPAYKNCLNGKALKKEVEVAWAPDGRTYGIIRNVFQTSWTESGALRLSKIPGAPLMPSGKYRLEIRCEGMSKPAYVNLAVKSGTAKFTVDPVALYVNDIHDQALLRFTTKDQTLNAVERVELKDAKLAKTYEVVDLGSGQFALELIPGAVAKSGTVALNVFLKGSTGTKPTATVSVKVKIR